MKRRFSRLVFRASPDDEENLSAWLWSCGTLGVELQDLPSGELLVIASFETEKALGKEELGDLAALLPGVELVDSSEIEDCDWLKVWREAAEPIPLGKRLLVDPREWETSAAGNQRTERRTDGDGRFVLQIPARTAFGVGSHESTRLAYELLEATDLAGKRVLDVGCGTGILAMAALLLGAREAVAFDFDPAAALLAGQYGRHNGVEPGTFTGTIAALKPPDKGSARFDIVVLNVLPHEIAEELDQVVAQLAHGGELLVSGVLDVESTRVRESIVSQGCESAGEIAAGEWRGLRFRRIADRQRPGIATTAP